MRPHPNRRRFRPAGLASTAAVLASVIIVAACGSSTPTGSTVPAQATSRTAARAPTDARSTSTLAFSKCMRASGVPNFPDLTGHGMLIQAGTGQTLTVNGVAVDAPAFQAARARCQKYLPAEHPSPAQAARQRQRGLRFANCMRSHGVPSFPDPKVISSHGGNQQVYLPGVNLQSPAFQSAAKACGGFGPKGP
jgi:hypothetical protein